MPAFQQNMATSVPAAPPQMQSGPADVSQQLDAIFSQNSQELQKLAVAATTPVAGPHATSVPASLNRPETGFQGAPLDHREVVGAGNARGQGIGNSIIATLNTIGAVKNTMDNKKKVEIASSTQQLVTAQAAADQAKQIMAANPDQNSAAYKQAKEAFDHNTQIQGTILTGKHGKDIMKGFNIDYTDPSANKTIQHDAVAMGKKRAEAAAKFNEGTPTTMTVDPQAQARYANSMAQQKAIQEYQEKRMTYEAAMAGHKATVEAKYVEQETELQKQHNQIRAQNEQRIERFNDRVKMLGYQDMYATRRLQKESDMAVERDRRILDMKDVRPDFILKEATQSAREWDGRMQAAQVRIDAANNNLENIQRDGKGPGDPQYDKATASLEQATDDQMMVQDQSDYSLNAYNLKLARAGIEPIPVPGSRAKVGAEKAKPNPASTEPGTTNNFVDYLNAPQ